jgi:tetratricopeptide (TPR) repeat protein
MKQTVQRPLKHGPERGRWWSSHHARRKVVAGLLLFVVSLVLVVGWIYYQETPLREALRLEGAQQHENALRWAEFYLQHNPTDVHGLALKARLLTVTPAMIGPQQAVEIFDRIGAASIDDLHAFGVAYMRLSQWSRSVPLLQRVVELDPQNALAWYELTTCRMRLGLLNEALESASKYTELSGFQARGLLLQAAIQNDMSNVEEAANLHAEILKLTPDAKNLMIEPGSFFVQYGTLLGMIGRNEESVAMLERAAVLEPRPYVYVNLGTAHSAAGDVTKAVGAWRFALNLDPGNPQAREALARISLEDGHPEEGLRLMKGLDQNPAMASTTAYLFQRLYVVQGDLEKAQQWEQRVAKLRKEEERQNSINQFLVRAPRSYWAGVIRAYQYAKDQNWKQAGDLLKEVVEIDDSDPFVQKLVQAVNERGPLPAIDELPLRHF